MSVGALPANVKGSTVLAIPGYGFTFAPQLSQNFAPGLSCAPQLVQKRLTISVTGSAGFAAGRVVAAAVLAARPPTAALEASKVTEVVDPVLIQISCSKGVPA